MIYNNKFSRYLSGLNFFERLYGKNLLMNQEDKLNDFTSMSDEQISKLRVTAMQGWFEKQDKPAYSSRGKTHNEYDVNQKKNVKNGPNQSNIRAVSYTHLTLPTICSV